MPEFCDHFQLRLYRKMNRTLFFAALISVVAALPAWNQLDNYSFDQFLADFKLKYHPSELTGRKALFETELKRVQAHNAQGKSWKETVTKFAAMTTQEKKAYFGRNKGMHKALKANKPQSEKPLPADFQLKPVNQLPANVDWRSQGRSGNFFTPFFNYGMYIRRIHTHTHTYILYFHHIFLILCALYTRHRFPREGPGSLRVLLGLRLHCGKCIWVWKLLWVWFISVFVSDTRLVHAYGQVYFVCFFLFS
ncbi:hypothetical protein EON65_12415 [archaeon]|nr:MAG: hypothetical protein EON65_12415 [archaeon]